MSRSFNLTLTTLGLLLVPLILWSTKSPPQSVSPIPLPNEPSAFPSAQPTPPSPTASESAPRLDSPPPPSDTANVYSPLASELNAEGFDATHDVNTLHTLVRQYFRRLQKRPGIPIGNDVDLARVLTGQNPMKYAALPKNHPALGPEGHLCDRWGTPYFVHPTGRGAFKIRSAGPDRTLFTEDDLIADPTASNEE